MPREARLDVVETTAQPSRAASARGARSPVDMWRLARAAAGHAFDVFFFPAVYSFYPLLRRVPSVITFHDAIADGYGDLVFPGRWPRLLWDAKTWVARRQADLILTVSESARDDIVRCFGGAAKVRVIGEAAGPQFQVSGDADARRRVRGRYGLPAEVPLLLHVGGLSPHKNLGRLLLALETLAGPEPAWHLALVGNDTTDGFHSEVATLRQIIRRTRPAGTRHPHRRSAGRRPRPPLQRGDRARACRRWPKGSACPRWRRWPAACPSRPAAAARCPRSSARPPSSSIPWTLWRWRPWWRACSRTPRCASGSGGTGWSGRARFRGARRRARRWACARSWPMRERRLRFCMVTTFYPPYHFGGDAVFVHRLAQALAEEGHTRRRRPFRRRLPAASGGRAGGGLRRPSRGSRGMRWSRGIRASSRP